MKISMHAASIVDQDSKKRYIRATSSKEATGIRTTVQLGCYYTPRKGFDTEDSSTVVDALRALVSIAGEVFIQPLREVLPWRVFADAIQAKLSEDMPQPKTTANILGNEMSAQMVSQSYTPFDGEFQITQAADDTLAYIFPVEYESYRVGVVKAIIDSGHSFGTVCMKGHEIELSIEQKKPDTSTPARRNDLDRLSDQMATL